MKSLLKPYLLKYGKGGFSKLFKQCRYLQDLYSVHFSSTNLNTSDIFLIKIKSTGEYYHDFIIKNGLQKFIDLL